MMRSCIATALAGGERVPRVVVGDTAAAARCAAAAPHARRRPRIAAAAAPIVAGSFHCIATQWQQHTHLQRQQHQQQQGNGDDDGGGPARTLRLRRQQQQHPHPSSRTGARLPDPEIYAAVQACVSVEDCAALLYAKGARFDAMLVSAMMTRTVRVAERQRSSSSSSSGGGLAPLSSSSTAATTSPLDAHLAKLAAIALAQARGSRPKQFANVLWGFARLGHRPPPAWLDAYLGAFEARLIACPAGELARVAWALGALKYVPRSGWLGGWLAEAAERLGDFSGRDLANSLWALAALGASAPHDWLRDAAAAVEQRLGDGGGGGGGSGPQHHQWQQQHPQQQKQRNFTKARQTPLKPYELSVCVWALARLGHVPPDAAWLGAVVDAALRGAAHVSAREAARALWALARWGAHARPSPPRAAAALASAALAALRREPRLDGRALSVSLAAIARLRARLSADEESAMLALVAKGWRTLTARELSRAVSAVAAMPLRAPPPTAWLRGFEAASLAHLEAAANGTVSAADAAQLLWSMRKLRWRPSERWWAAAYGALAGPLLRRATVTELAMVLHSLAALRAPRPGPELVGAVWRRLALLLNVPAGVEAPPGDAAASGAAPDDGSVRAGLALPTAAAPLQQLLPRGAAAAIKLSEAAAILWAAAHLGIGAPPPPLLLALGAVVACGLAAASDADALRSLWALVRFGLGRQEQQQQQAAGDGAGAGAANNLSAAAAKPPPPPITASSQLARLLVARGWARRAAMAAASSGGARHLMSDLLTALNGGRRLSSAERAAWSVPGAAASAGRQQPQVYLLS